MKVLLLGAGGYIGKPLFKKLINNSNFSKVYTLSRSEFKSNEEK